MAWSLHAPSGTYRDHALSTKTRRQAIANAVTFQFLTPEPGFGRNRGQSATITRTQSLPLAGRVGELDQLPDGRMAVQSKDVSISQWGYKVPMTELEIDLTHFDLPRYVKMALRDQMALTMDVMARDAFVQTPIIHTPTSSGYTRVTDGTATATATRNLDVSDLREIHDYMSGTLLTPKYPDGYYRGIVSTQAARGIKNDPEYKDMMALAPRSKAYMMGELPTPIEGFRLIESNHSSAWANLVGSSTVCGEAIFFGADAAGVLEVRAPEIRMTGPLQEDMGRNRLVGWVGTLAPFLTWETAAQARAVWVTGT